MTLTLEKFTQPELTGDTAQELPGLEIDVLWGRQGLAVGITFQLGNIVTSIGFRIAIYGVIVKYTNIVRLIDKGTYISL